MTQEGKGREWKGREEEGKLGEKQHTTKATAQIQETKEHGGTTHTTQHTTPHQHTPEPKTKHKNTKTTIKQKSRANYD